jgi:signal transduction histidine kinase
MKVVIVDDDESTRQYLSNLVSRHDFTVAGEAADGRSALDVIDLTEPDLVLMDREMPGMGGTEATRLALKAHPEIKVVALTGSDESEDVAEMIAAGASGYLLKGADPVDLVAALTAVSEGRAVLDERVTRSVLKELANQYEKQRSRADALAELDQMKSEFISVISHELRTPLTFISGAARTMNQRWEKLPDDEKRFLTRAIEHRSDSFARLINQLLMVAMVESSSLEVQSSICNLDVLAREALHNARPKKGLRAADLELDPVTVRGDSSLITEMARSLIENAFEFTDGRVVIRTCALDGWGSLEVHDDGPGLTRESLQGVLASPFNQGDSSSTRSVGGLGLSLYLANRILEASGGKFDVRTDAESGSTFALSFPIS